MDIFMLKLLLSFAVGGAYIAFTIWLSEKYGSKIGGIIIGLPSTSLVALFFIGWSQDLQAALSAVQLMPALLAANPLFVAAFVLWHRHGREKALLAALLLWFAINLPLVLLGIEDIWLSIFIAAILFAIAIALLRGFPHRKLPHLRSTLPEFLLRSAFAGSIVALSVFLAREMGPLWGGLFASFPAAYSSSMLIIERKHGIGFAASVGRTMPYGSMATVAFMLTFFLTASQLGLLSGLALSFAVSLAAGALLYRMKI